MVYEIERGLGSAIAESPSGVARPIVFVVGHLPAGLASTVASAARVVEYADWTWSSDDSTLSTCDASARQLRRPQRRGRAIEVDDATRQQSLQVATIAVDADILASLSPVARPAAHTAILHSVRRPNVSMVARWLGTSARNLQRDFVDARLPPPSGLIRLARWLVFARTVGGVAVSSQTFARVAGFATVASFHKGLLRELCLSVSEVRSTPTMYERLREAH